MYSVVTEATGEIEQGEAHREGVVREGFSEVLPELGRGAARERSELCTGAPHIRTGPR